MAFFMSIARLAIQSSPRVLPGLLILPILFGMRDRLSRLCMFHIFPFLKTRLINLITVPKLDGNCTINSMFLERSRLLLRRLSIP